jgi:tetratricopeptide (TPR) repeat protein
MGYLFVLKKLAHVAFMSRKFSDSEKYFTIIADMMPEVTKNPANHFSARKNLLLFYTYTNIEQASEYGKRMIKDQDEFYPVHVKDLYFMLGNVETLKSDYRKAKDFYRKVLKLGPQPALESQILNNLAFASWMHLIELPKIKAELLGPDVSEGTKAEPVTAEQRKEFEN